MINWICRWHSGNYFTKTHYLSFFYFLNIIKEEENRVISHQDFMENSLLLKVPCVQNTRLEYIFQTLSLAQRFDIIITNAFYITSHIFHYKPICLSNLAIPVVWELSSYLAAGNVFCKTIAMVRSDFQHINDQTEIEWQWSCFIGILVVVFPSWHFHLSTDRSKVSFICDLSYRHRILNFISKTKPMLHVNC